MIRRHRIAVARYDASRRAGARWRLRWIAAGRPITKTLGEIGVTGRVLARVHADPQAFIRFAESLAVPSPAERAETGPFEHYATLHGALYVAPGTLERFRLR